jgi:hypothetical protein
LLQTSDKNSTSKPNSVEALNHRDCLGSRANSSPNERQTSDAGSQLTLGRSVRPGTAGRVEARRWARAVGPAHDGSSASGRDPWRGRAILERGASEAHGAGRSAGSCFSRVLQRSVLPALDGSSAQAPSIGPAREGSPDPDRHAGRSQARRGRSLGSRPSPCPGAHGWIFFLIVAIGSCTFPLDAIRRTAPACDPSAPPGFCQKRSSRSDLRYIVVLLTLKTIDNFQH